MSVIFLKGSLLHHRYLLQVDQLLPLFCRGQLIFHLMHVLWSFS